MGFLNMLARRTSRKYFDSADYFKTGEVNPSNPYTRCLSSRTNSNNPYTRCLSKSKSNHSHQKKLQVPLQRPDRKFFDSAEWTMTGEINTPHPAYAGSALTTN